MSNVTNVDPVTFFTMCERHDWYYAFSDDHRVWRAGEEASKKLQALAKTVDGGQEIHSAWSKYMFSGEPWGTVRPAKPEAPSQAPGVVGLECNQLEKDMDVFEKDGVQFPMTFDDIPVSDLQCLQSAAGWYIGRVCWNDEFGFIEPYSRESEYFGNLEAAEVALASKSFEVRDCIENNWMYSNGFPYPIDEE
jgi:hypothetical protein